MEAQLKENLIKAIESDPTYKQNLENHLKRFSFVAFKKGNKDGYITEQSLLDHYKNIKFKNKEERDALLPVIEGSVKAALLALVLTDNAIRIEDEHGVARYKFNEKKDILKEMLILEKESLLKRIEFIDNELKNFE